MSNDINEIRVKLNDMAAERDAYKDLADWQRRHIKELTDDLETTAKRAALSRRGRYLNENPKPRQG